MIYTTVRVSVACSESKGLISVRVRNGERNGYSSFFQNEEIFVQLNELDRITHARIGFNYSFCTGTENILE